MRKPKSRALYARMWRKENPDAVAKIQARYWAKKASGARDADASEKE